VFSISNVTGEGLATLSAFLSHLKSREGRLLGKNCPFEFDIHERFIVAGVGMVLSGLIRSGTAVVNKPLLLGPDIHTNFKSIQIKSIHVNRSPVDQAFAG